MSTKTDSPPNHATTQAATSIRSASQSPSPGEVFRLAGKRAAMVVFSRYPSDPRPRRAAKALLEEGMRVDLICEGEKGSPKLELSGRLEIIRIPVEHRRGGVLSYFYQYFAFTLFSATVLAWRSLRKRYDLVYVHNMPDVLVMSALIPKWFGAKVILDQHDPMPELMKTIFGLNEKSLGIRLIRHLEKWSIAQANFVITVNAACKRLISKRSCLPEKIGVVMNAPDEEIFPFREAKSYPARTPDSPFVVMYHGSLVQRNGADLLVDTLASLRKVIPAIELRIYGRSNSYFEQVLEKARSLDLLSCIRYMGSKTLEELVQEIEACDVGIIPNHRNEFTNINIPTRIFEYLALGKPVVAPQTPGIQDYFGPDSLFFFEAGNVKALAQRILEVYSHPELAVETAERGQEVYMKHTWSQERQTLVDLVGGIFKLDKANSSHLQSAPD
jgi:glycosyltransferase involved in cell wall biosynthesis